MLVEICKGLWLNPYEIVEIRVDIEFVTIEYRSSPSLITNKRYHLENEVAALEEARRVAELVNTFYDPSLTADESRDSTCCSECGKEYTALGTCALRTRKVWVCYACDNSPEGE